MPMVTVPATCILPASLEHSEHCFVPVTHPWPWECRVKGETTMEEKAINAEIYKELVALVEDMDGEGSGHSHCSCPTCTHYATARELAERLAKCCPCGSEDFEHRSHENVEPHGERHTDEGCFCVACGAEREE